MNQSTQTDTLGQFSTDNTFSIILKGIHHHVLPVDATRQLSALFKVSEEQVKNLLTLPSYAIKRAVPLAMALQYKRAIEAAGGVCEILPESTSVVEFDIGASSPETNIPQDRILHEKMDVSRILHSTSSNTSSQFNSLNLKIQKENMQNISELKEKINMTTWKLVLLTIATCGIYPILWLTIHYKTINTVTKKPTIDTTYIIWIGACIGFSNGLKGTYNETLNLLVLFLSVAGYVLYVVWAFKAKNALQEYALNEHKVDLRMNPFYTILFHIFYINYCINDLPEAKRKQQILRGQSAT